MEAATTAVGKEGGEEQGELRPELVPCYTEAVKWLCRLGGTSVGRSVGRSVCVACLCALAVRACVYICPLGPYYFS